MKKSEQINEIVKALCKFHNSVRPAIKDSSNPHFKGHKFATINSAWEAIRQPLTENGLCVVQDVTTEAGFAIIETEILHESGQWMTFGPLRLPTVKNDAQGYGSAVTYAKRYALFAALGLTSAEEDDDGNAACAPAPIRLISSKDAKELYQFLDACAPDFKNFILNDLSNRLQVRDLFALPQSMYDGLRLTIEQQMNK